MSHDDDVLRMLAGANFGPNAKVVLPSGREIGGDEAQALTSFYAPARNEQQQTSEPTLRALIAKWRKRWTR